MSDISETLARWEASLCQEIEVAGLLSRQPVAHKWKAPFRSLILRETSFWRLHDTMRQSYRLHLDGLTLGARILLRSGFETTALLVYLNAQMRNVVEENMDFHKFSEITSRLLLGSKEKSTQHEAINVLTTLKAVERKHPGLESVFASLSESAHPNWEGMGYGYSRIDHDRDIALFSNNLQKMFEESHLPGMKLCMALFEDEYNNIWPRNFEALEAYLVSHDKHLEATKGNDV